MILCMMKGICSLPFQRIGFCTPNSGTVMFIVTTILQHILSQELQKRKNVMLQVLSFIVSQNIAQRGITVAIIQKKDS